MKPLSVNTTRPQPWMKSSINSTTVFSKHHAKDGFWGIHIDVPSSYLTIFNTHKGCYHLLYMPFGLKMSQDIFQMHIEQVTDSLPRIFVIHDVICIYGRNTKEHDKHLQLMKTTSCQGLIFNNSKYSISQPQITFYRVIFPAQDMKPDLSKVQTLQDLPTPDNQTKLQSFLGLINYLQPFLPSLASKTTSPREHVIY